MTDPLQKCFSEARLNGLTLRNRLIKAATFEGKSKGGRISPELTRLHQRIGEGGIGMTTLAYCAVSSEGRTYRHQIWIRDEARAGLRRFRDAMHAEGAKVSIQLGHAGWFASPRAMGMRPIGPSRSFSPHAQAFSRAMSPEQLDQVIGEFADATRLAVEAGFDAIEVHVGHGYLLSQFLCPYNNRRRDRWGGSLENRARFPRQVLRAVREAAGPGAAVTAKPNMEDGFAKGLQLDEGLEVARMIERDGSVDAFQLTGGHTTRTPMFLMRGDVPLGEMIRNQRGWVRRLGMRLLAPSILQPWKFEEAFFLPNARRYLTELSLPLMLLGGLTRLDTMQRAIDEGFAFVSLGRALIREPDLVRQMQTGETDAALCIPCNRCIVEMDKGGTRCVMRPAPPNPPSFAA